MSKVVFDTFILNCPVICGHDFVNEYIQALLDWKELQDSTWITVFLSSESMQILSDVSGYPPWDPVAKTVKTHHPELQPEDIYRLINWLLNRVPYLEDFLEIEDLDFDKFECKPDNSLPNRDAIFANHLNKLMIFSCLLREKLQNDSAEIYVATKGIKNENCVVSISAEIAQQTTHSNVYSRTLAGQVRLTQKLISIFDGLDSLELWRAGQCSLALNVAVTQIMREANIESQREWRFGDAFEASIEDLGLCSNKTVLKTTIRACVETILKMNLHATHHLRDGAGPNDPQCRKGANKAWRRDIDHEYHLHYWETPYGPEFAKVVVHADTSI
ncbi:MAG: hypothetical protein KIT34_05360 [Cyanobacteria bacterium TGS_CYA1]|nr:hypothetical protein [Cyanobacteria bacterium TGS_CYA1]